MYGIPCACQQLLKQLNKKENSQLVGHLNSYSWYFLVLSKYTTRIGSPGNASWPARNQQLYVCYNLCDLQIHSS